MSQVIASFESVTKRYHLGHERSNLRAALPGRWGEASGRNTFAALEDVSFEVHAGEALGIIGPNGAGKSTVLKVIAGVVRPDSGTVMRPVRTVSIIELGLGFDPDMNALENLEYGGSMLGMRPEEVRAKRDEIIEFAELGSFLDMPVKRYSSGMLARLGFALATSVEADLFVVDEVLSVGDWGFQRRSLERMRELNQRGAAILFVSHNLWIVAQLCERAVLLETGQVRNVGPANQVIGQYVGQTPYLNDLPDEVMDRSPEAVVLAASGAAPAVLDASVHYRIGELEFDPPEIGPGDPVTLRTTVEVRQPVPGVRLLIGAYWEGFAAFSAPDELPAECLQEVGTHEIVIRYPVFASSPALVTFQLAVVDANEPDDPEQVLPNSLVKQRGDMKVVGEVTGRPGVALPREFSVRRLGEFEERPDA